MVLSRGDFSVFVTRPISATLLLAAVALALVVLPIFRKTREEAFHEED